MSTDGRGGGGEGGRGEGGSKQILPALRPRATTGKSRKRKRAELAERWKEIVGRPVGESRGRDPFQSSIYDRDGKEED